MGYTTSGGPKGLGAVTDSNTPLSDFNQVIALIARVGNTQNGDQADRDAITGGELYAGLIFTYDDQDRVDFYTGSGWEVLWENADPEDIVTFGTGWAQTTGVQHTPRLVRNGQVVSLYGSVTSSAGYDYSNILTIPVAYRPTSTGTRFVGSGVASNGMAFQLALSSGVLTVPVNYATGTIPVAQAHPIVASWIVD